MPWWIRKLLATFALGVVLLLSPLVVAHAETPSPTPTPTVSAGEGSEADSGEGGDIADSPDVELDQTRTLILLVGAGGLAAVAAIVVFLRR